MIDIKLNEVIYVSIGNKNKRLELALVIIGLN